MAKETQTPQAAADRYVGTLVGESTSTEFRLAVAHEMVREQDIIAVDAELRRPNNEPVEMIRVWAKVKRIERLNPLFPTESGHELAATRTNPFDTILSLSREMVTAVCQVLGSEPLDAAEGGKLSQLRYPPQPATSAYRPETPDVTRVVVGGLQDKEKAMRALDVAYLANRKDVEVKVDGHYIVTRHLAILAMTGSGKTWASRRIIEELAKRNYPIVIFDPHGDYTGMADVPSLKGKVRRFYADFPVFEQDAETVIRVIGSLAWELADNMRSIFPAIFKAAQALLKGNSKTKSEQAAWIAQYISSDGLSRYGMLPNLFFLADFAAAVIKAGKTEDKAAADQIVEWTDRQELRLEKKMAGYVEALPNRLRVAGSVLQRMKAINEMVAKNAEALPTDRTSLVRYGGVSIVSLAGYTSEFQATLYSLIANDIFDARVSGKLKLPVLLVLEEAHNFVPAKANTAAEERSVAVTKQIAQEGRKFGVGLVIISQRPSRLDETALSQCNSYLVMRMVNPADQNFVRKVIETLGEDDARLLPDLDKGEALLSGQFINFPVLVKMKEPETRGDKDEEDAFISLEKIKAAEDEQARRQTRS